MHDPFKESRDLDNLDRLEKGLPIFDRTSHPLTLVFWLLAIGLFFVARTIYSAIMEAGITQYFLTGATMLVAAFLLSKLKAKHLSGYTFIAFSLSLITAVMGFVKYGNGEIVNLESMMALLGVVIFLVEGTLSIKQSRLAPARIESDKVGNDT